MPKVTIVMPVYNGEAFIRDALDSILQQSFTDWECIVVNEWGSGAAVTDILREYAAADQRIRVLQNSSRLYIAASLNEGLRAAKGTYIARMDADDIAGRRRLEVQVAYMDTHPEIDICGLKVNMFGTKPWDWTVYSDDDYLRCACLFYTPFIHPTVMMRASSLKKFGLEYDPDYHYTEDYEFFSRACQKLRCTNLQQEGLYYYRFTPDNATNVGGAEGVRLQNEIMKRLFAQYDLHFTEEQIRLLSPNVEPEIDSADEALEQLDTLDLLLKKVLLQDAIREQFGADCVFRVLHRRWEDKCIKMRREKAIMKDSRVQQAMERGLFHRERFTWRRTVNGRAGSEPRVSIVMPAFNSEQYILDTLFSLLEQDFTDYELLIVNEFGSDDQTLKCISLFEDDRIRVIQNQTRLGLAESLNEGLRQARGEYVARADADDIYPANRLSEQVEYMDRHPDVALCGTWQHHFGKRNHDHKPPASPEAMKAELLFRCEVCHSTVMLRRKAFADRDLWYDPTYLSEDFELWARAAGELKFATIPKVLGQYRWTGDNITAKKMALLDEEAQRIIARSLEQNLGMKIPQEDLILLSGWMNPFQDGREDQQQLQQREDELLRKIEQRNEQVHAYDPKALRSVLDVHRKWAGIPVEKPEKPAAKKPAPNVEAKKGNPLKRCVKKLLKPIYHPFRRRYEERLIRLENATRNQRKAIKELQKSLWNIDGHLFDYYHALESLQKKYKKQIEALQIQICGIPESVQDSQRALDSRIWKAEQSITQTMDSRMWKAEQNVTQTLDARVWKAEQNVTQTLDARVWKAEQNINQTTDARVWKAEQNVTQTLDGRIWSAEQNILHLQKNGLRLQAASMLGSEDQARRIFLIGTPEHNNIGDAAIVNGEIEFVRRYFPGSRLIDIPDNDLGLWYEAVRTTIRPGDMIFLQGGGNMGSRYLREESVRRQVIGDFRDCPVVILPQTAYYDDSEAGRKELATTAAIFAGHPHLTILARGDRSLELMREHFPGAKSACVPDMALLLEKDYGLERKGVLLCIRALNDESGLTDSQYTAVMAAAREIDGQAENTDNLYQGGYEGRIWQDMRREVVEQQLRRFASSQVVVTDRLHGLIFALITHTPCVVFSSYNYKIGEFCRTFVHTDGVIFLDNDVERLPAAIRAAMEHGPLESTGVDFGLYAQAQQMIREDTGWA